MGQNSFASASVSFMLLTTRNFLSAVIFWRRISMLLVPLVSAANAGSARDMARTNKAGCSIFIMLFFIFYLPISGLTSCRKRLSGDLLWIDFGDLCSLETSSAHDSLSDQRQRHKFLFEVWSMTYSCQNLRLQ